MPTSTRHPEKKLLKIIQEKLSQIDATEILADTKQTATEMQKVTGMEKKKVLQKLSTNLLQEETY